MDKGSLFLFFLTLTLNAQSQISRIQDSLEIIKLIQGSDDLRRKGNYLEAQPMAESARDLALERFGEQDPLFAYSLHNLGTIFLSRGLHKEAEVALTKALQIRKEKLGQQHTDYGKTLNNLAVLYEAMSRYSEAERLLLEALSIKEASGRKDSLDYSSPLGNLGGLYLKMGRYSESEKYYRECLTLREKLMDKNPLPRAGALLGLANVHLKTGRYRAAEKWFLEVRDTVENRMGKNGELYFKSVGGLAVLYWETGRYEEAEPLLHESLQLIKQYDKNGTDYAIGLNNAGLFYAAIGQFDKAEAFYLQALDSSERIWGKTSYEYARVLDNLGSMYYATYQGDEKAEQYFLQAKETTEEVFGKKHPEYARITGNLALLYVRMEVRRQRSEELYLEILQIYKSIGSEETLANASALHNLALLYYMTGRLEEAQQLLFQAIDIKKKIVGTKQGHYLRSLSNLADIYVQMGDWSTAIYTALSANEIHKDLMLQGANYLSEREMTQWMNVFEERTERWHSYAWRYDDDALTAMIYDNALFYKGFLLEAAMRFHKNAKRADGDAKSHYEEWKECHRKLAAEYAKPFAQQGNVKELEAKANQLEKQLVRTMKDFDKELRQVSWQEVQAKLKPDEAAVEFIRFRLNYPRPTDTVLYAALVLLPGDKSPRYVKLFDESHLKKIVQSNVDSNGLSINSLYSFAPNGSNLYELIWRPLEPMLSRAKRIYYAPAGGLHRIAFSAIPIDSTHTRYLGDSFVLIQVGSTRQLTVSTSTMFDAKLKTAAVFGGIDYNTDIVSTNRGTNKKGKWGALEESKQEAERVAQLLGLKQYKVALYTGDAATEAALKQLGNQSPAPAVLHISTHGYFFPGQQGEAAYFHERGFLSGEYGERQLAFGVSEHPLIRSGLIFAGANHAWDDGYIPSPGKEDGTMTAYEISQLDLKETEFVFLSACHTGLGDIEGDEGVQGLQRAFKIAGARHILVSLWETDDEASKELMDIFYRKILQNTDIHFALQSAQREIRVKYPNPYFWGSFVLME
ncbi:MAG: CHAT domain-containing protein [Saprospiraceae bacterium]|nr:CHAT domain-containing protein [Saprospiraceae bacterium]